jgi:PAS domain-containing protein
MDKKLNPEYLRLNAVRRFTELKGSEKQDLDDLVAVAAQICGKPIALVTLLDSHTQWFKATKGADITSMDREQALCNYTIAQNEVLVVEDAQKDERFSGNPLVTGAPNVRFYAGAPLTTHDGYNVGSLCVIDLQPGKLSPAEVSSLQALARQVMHRMELSNTVQSLQHTMTEIDAQKNELQNLAVIHNAYMNSFNDYFVLLDKNLNIVAFNQSWKEFAEQVFKRSPCAGDKMIDFVSGEMKKDFNKLVFAALSGETVEIERIAHDPHMRPFRYKARLAPFSNLEGQVIGISVIATDIEKEKQQGEVIDLKNKTLLEIARLQSHNIRMPLSNILGILNLIKLEGYPAQEQYFDYLQQSADELDKVIVDIVFKADRGRSILPEQIR